MRKILLFASLLCVLTSTYALGVGGDMGGADPNGSPGHPYLIEDLADFDTFADPNNAATYWAAGVHTKLMTDIDLSGRTYNTAVIAPDTDTDSGWDGIEYTGYFNGNHHVINKLSINGSYYYMGLFGRIGNTATIINLSLENVGVTGSGYYIGGIVGYMNMGTVNSCYVTGQIAGSYYIGGLVGRNYAGSIILSHTDMTVNTTGSSNGGLVGYNDIGTITSCHTTGQVLGDGSLGGLVGFNYEGAITYSYSSSEVDSIFSGVRIGGLIGDNVGSITYCYATGSVTGYANVGGLIGDHNNETASHCYSTGNVSGVRVVGGLIGHNGGVITACYSTGQVVADRTSGGLIGGNYLATVTACFWDTETSGIGDPGDDNYSATGKSTSEMQTLSTFTDAGWDFTIPDWMMLREGEDYPRLAWQEIFPGDIAGLYGADIVDFAYLADYWGLSGCNSGVDCGRADIDGSGDVGLGDLAAVAADLLK